MYSEDQRPSDLVYGLGDRPRPLPASPTTLQYVLANSVGIVTPSLVIGSLLGLGEYLPYLISMVLMVSSTGTLIQARRPFGIGVGMICLQGTSFTFLDVVLAAEMLMKQRGGDPEEILAMISDVCFPGALVQIVLSRLLDHLRQVVTPPVINIVITLTGVSLIKVGITDLDGGAGVTDFGVLADLALGALVLLSIVLLNRSRLSWLCLAAIAIGLVLGTLAAWTIDLSIPRVLPELPLVSPPQPSRLGFASDRMVFLPVALIYLISSTETVGDLTANCIFLRRPPKGPAYLQWLCNGVFGDSVSRLLAAIFSVFPNTTFAQNNGVIQLTGVASQHVGIYIGGVLPALSLFPWVGAALQQIPKPVPGGAALMMFGSAATTDIRILGQTVMGRRSVLIIAAPFDVSLGAAAQPTLLDQMPAVVKTLFDSAIISGGITVALLNLPLPEERVAEAVQVSAKGGALARWRKPLG